MQHQTLANGRFREMSLAEQLAAVASEVERAISWEKRGNAEYSLLAQERALELLDLSLNAGHGGPTLRELARAREGFVDFFFGENSFNSSPELWQHYFSPFTYAVQLQRGR